MADYNLQGRWLQSNLEINIVMTTPTEFNIKAISAELQQYWTAGYGEVLQSGKFRITLNGRNGDVEYQGFVTGNQREIRFNSGTVWKRR